MKAIINFFKAINSTLNDYVDYMDTRVRTGKFVGDIRYKMNQDYVDTWKFFANSGHAIKKSRIVHALEIFFGPLWRILLRIHLFKNLVALFVDTIKLLITFYAEIFIVFAMTFPTSILLLNLFQSSITNFFIALIPILFWNMYVISALYYCIDKRSAGERISIWHSFLIVLGRFGKISFPPAIYTALILEGIVGFFVLTLFITHAFTFVHVSWNSSFLYWFLVAFAGLCLFWGMFVITVILHQTYFAVLLDGLNFHQAIVTSKKHVRQHLPEYLCFYLLFFVYCALFIARAVLSYLYLGFIVSLFAAITIGVFLGFLLRRNFLPKPHLQEVVINKEKPSYTLFAVILVFGFINYLLVAQVITRDYQPILAFVQQQQDNFLASQRVKQYTNEIYHYTLSYPKNWSIYEWKDNSITFYNNYTGTISGGTWLSIRVTPYDQNSFTYLSRATPGVVSYDPQSKNVTTKISNFSIQGYNGVNYSTVIAGIPYPQYETHYIIHKEDYLYDVVFTSLANDVDGYDSELFDKIINSFKFIE